MRSDNSKPGLHEESESSTTDEPTEELLLPDIYAEINWSPKLTLEQDATTEAEESDGFDPYDTAVLQKRNRG